MAKQKQTAKQRRDLERKRMAYHMAHFVAVKREGRTPSEVAEEMGLSRSALTLLVRWYRDNIEHDVDRFLFYDPPPVNRWKVGNEQAAARSSQWRMGRRETEAVRLSRSATVAAREYGMESEVVAILTEPEVGIRVFADDVEEARSEVGAGRNEVEV